MRPYLLAPRFAANRLWLAAREVPSWHIAPVRTGTVTDLITGSQIITFTNSSPAWGFNSSGILVQPTANVPFVEYDPATGACLGWRIWDAVTNLLVRSEEFGTTWTTFQAVVTSNAGVAPTGSTTADLIAVSNGLTDGLVRQDVALPDNTSYTFSVFLKASGLTTCNLQFYNKSNTFNGTKTLNLLTGALSGFETGGTTLVQACPNGWYRLALQGASSGTGATTPNVRVFVPGVGNGTNGILAAGAQLNPGPLAPYVPTGALTASSTADVASILSWAAANNIRSAYIRGRTTASGTRGLLSGNDNSSSNRIEAITSGTDPRLQVTTSGSSVADIDGGTVVASTPFRMAMRFAANDFAVSINGGAVVTDTSGGLPTIDRWFLGRTQAGEYGNCYLEELALFTSGLNDSRLTAMGGV